MNDAFQRLMAKVLRAKKHIADLSDALDAFSNSKPLGLRYEDDQDTRERTYYSINVPDIPLDILAIVGDILQNLRSALDHLTCQLVLNAGKTPTKATCFPIADDIIKYRSKEFRKKMQGMKEFDINAIDALKPYKGGNDTLWHLHALNNIDKHRMLITACHTYRAYGMLPSERESMRQRLISSHSHEPAPKIEQIKEISPIVPLKVGDKLITIPYSRLGKNLPLYVDVSFNEPEIVGPEPLLETVHNMSVVVGKIVIQFALDK